MNFVSFNVLLLAAGFAAVIVFSIGNVACIAPVALFRNSKEPPKAAVYPIFAVAAGFQVYFWGFWAAFCVAITTRFTHKPEVTWDWRYWVAGFSWCTSLIGWLAHKEQMTSESGAEARSTARGTTLYSLVAIVAFLLFSFAPSLMSAVYGWALTPVGLSIGYPNRSENPAPTATPLLLTNEQRASVGAFFRGYEYLTSANKLARGLPTSNDSAGDLEKARSLFQSAQRCCESEVDISILNGLYPCWGDVTDKNLKPGLRFLLSGSGPGGDRSDLSRGDAVLAEFDQWLREHWNDIRERVRE